MVTLEVCTCKLVRNVVLVFVTMSRIASDTAPNTRITRGVLPPL